MTNHANVACRQLERAADLVAVVLVRERREDDRACALLELEQAVLESLAVEPGPVWLVAVGQDGGLLLGDLALPRGPALHVANRVATRTEDVRTDSLGLLDPTVADGLQHDQQHVLHEILRRRRIPQVAQPVAADPALVPAAQLALLVRCHVPPFYRNPGGAHFDLCPSSRSRYTSSVSFGITDLGLWDGSTALLLDGRDGPPVRPAIHLQAAAGGYLRLVGPDGPVLLGLVEPGWYAVDLARARTAGRLRMLPPLRVDEAERAGADLAWWTREYAARLVASPCTPLGLGRRYLLAPMTSSRSAPPGILGRDWQRRGWAPFALDLDALRDQGAEFSLSWDAGYLGLVLTRPLSDEDDGRVKSWRKRARDGKLPPLVTWWCRGLFSHVLLDGHDRLHAALLENIKPDVVTIADVSAHDTTDLERRRREALDQAALLEAVPSPDRGPIINSVLRAGWDPRLEWDLATPGFPLDLADWLADVRGTHLDARANAQTLQ